ncbi:TonB-dependent receptor [Novosphingobium sp. SG720]|uniref:TonB-dependent receptor n=1 Tax=Novosphingobium sp. SG720 TaxID=2586998 RepID=UPI001445CDE8|nr:TonB-dependent receptor [Novosphingobium sp. SG720]
MPSARARRAPLLAMACMAAIMPAVALAADENAPAPPPDDIVVRGRSLNQVGEATSGSQGVVGYADFENRPLSRVGELAENVPGLIATQHSGEGKANQYFLRGFNLDHGTDLASFIDGAPINLRSHGHGQGYSDLNFVIPELIEHIDYAKGPYNAQNGDFSAAGTMRLAMRQKLEAPFVQVTGGTYGYWRGLAAGSARLGQGTLLGAVELTANNGPWVRDEAQRKFNALLRYSTPSWSLSIQGTTNRWNATDQVPQRAIASGLIAANATIDPYLGGRSGRLAAIFNAQVGSDTAINAYVIGSRLQLTSNFTYFLNDPIHGDEFQQTDRRRVMGGSVIRTLEAGPVTWRLGAEARWDHIALGLYHAEYGQVTGNVREDRVDEESGALWAEGQVRMTSALRLVLGARVDAIGYAVHSNLAANSGTGSAALAAPKAALAWTVAPGVELYANYGEGYHSNDVRGATITVDPSTGAAASRVPVFARARGAEVGARIERARFKACLVGFALDLASELVFVGDEGATEPQAASRRLGVEGSLFWQPASWLALDASGGWTHARFRGLAAGEDFIPGATPFVLGGGASLTISPKVSFALRLRHFAGAPLIEDNSVRSQATSVVNSGLYWQHGRFGVGLDVLNLFNTHDPDISYYYASRLPGEAATGVDDVHVHPVEPRQARVTLRMHF